jgi:hypothetical protein
MIILAIPMPIRKTSATAEIVVSSQYSVLSAPRQIRELLSYSRLRDGDRLNETLTTNE